MSVFIKINLFGAFRDFNAGSTIAVGLKTGDDAQTVKANLGKALGGSDKVMALLSKSRLATDETVLLDHDIITESRELAILPPVAGG